MADQLNDLTSNATTGLNATFSFLPGPLQSSLSTLTSKSTSLLNSALPPSTRSNIKQKIIHFAQTRPKLASFLFSQLVVSGLPIALFVILTVTVFVFALLAGILVGVLGALVFIVGMVGLALVILLPTLFVTTFFAVAVWLWGLGAWYIVKWFNREGIEGVKSGEGIEGALDGLLGLDGNDEKEGGNREINGTSGGDDGVKSTSNGTGEKKDVGREKQTNGDGSAITTTSEKKTVAKADHHGDGKENRDQSQVAKSPQHKKKVKSADQTSTKNPAKTVTDATDGVTNTAKGVTDIVS